MMGGLEMIRVMCYGTDFSPQSDDIMGGQGMIREIGYGADVGPHRYTQLQ